MSSHQSLRRMAFDGRLDVIAAILGVVVAVGLFPLRFVTSQVFIETLPIVLGVASLLYLFAARKDRNTELARFSVGTARILPPLVVFGTAAMVVIAFVAGGRPLLYYNVAAAVGTALFAQVMFVDDEHFSPGLILGQVVLFGLVLRFTALLTSPGYIGIDVWTHVPAWSAAIADQHSLAPIATEKYYASPLFHLLVVATKLLVDTSLRRALFLSVGLAMPLSVVFAYSTTKFFITKRWSVFAATAYSLTAPVIEWGIHLIPTSLGLVFFLAILYSLTRMLYIDYRPRDFLLVVIFSVAVILTHQVSAFIMLVFTGAGLAAYVLLWLGIFDIGTDSDRSAASGAVNLSGLLAFDLGLITFMWSLTPYQGGTFLGTVGNYFYETVSTDAGFLNLANPSAGGESIPPSAFPQPSAMDTFVSYLDPAGFLLLLLLTVVGSLYVLRQHNVSHATFTSVIATVVMLVFVFGFPLFGIRTFVPGRWFAFLAAPMALIGAIGLAYLGRNSRPSVAVALMLVFAITFPTVSVLASPATQDSPPFDATQTRYSYTDAELSAVDTISDISDPRDDYQIRVDHPYGTVFERTDAHRAEVMTVTDGTVENRTVVYRDYQASGAAYVNNPYEIAVQPTLEPDQVCSGRRDVTYANGDVYMCTAAGATDAP